MQSNEPIELATSFGAVAPYYDELMKQVPYRMWVGYYFLLLSQQDIHPRRVVDVACGTGTMTQMLAREGFEMSGFDLSAPMIEIAKEKARKSRQKIDYFVANACEWQTAAPFDGALSFFDSLNNILETVDLQAAFDSVARNLRPGGSWIFDLNTRYAFQEQMFDQANLRKNAKLRYDWKGDWNPSTQLIRVHMKFWYEDQEFEEVHIQRAYEVDDVLEMLGRAGFVNIRTFHSYSLDPVRARTDRVHFVCERS
jgi:SAM-dependent methyltransferase